MKLNDLLSNNKPFVIDGETVEGVFIKQIPVSKFSDIEKLNSTEDRAEKLSIMENIIKYSLINADGTQAIQDNQELPVSKLDKIAEAIFEANDLSGKSDTEQEELPNT